jgi:UDP-hydrolysing UDP-N-acetyl-D-glucosamine 2-epimerase
MSRRICVFTGTRAEYGLLYWLMKELMAAAEVELQVLVSGAHLVPELGETWRQITADGFPVSERVEMVLASDTPTGIAASLGLGVMRLAGALSRLAPDILVVLGDRYEALAAASAAMCLRIPIAHIHGGETTQGAIDEAIRHAITKMAHLHFTAAEPYRRRVIQLGEDPARVFNVGAPGVDNLVRLPLLSRRELLARLGFASEDRFLLVTYHPVTLSRQDPAEPFGRLLEALERFAHLKLVITKANADTYGKRINRLIDQYAAAHPARVYATANLGQVLYLSALKHCECVVGNSSSGILEAPAAGVPTVNLGPRQEGRLRCASILDCPEDTEAIAAALEKALDPAFREMCRGVETPYGKGGAARRMAEVLKTWPLQGILFKRFYDLPAEA